MSAASQYFEENLPRRPHYTGDLTFDLRIPGKGCAFFTRYIQQNQPHTQFWLVSDVGREGITIDGSGWNAPVPNIIVKNPMNGYIRLLYALNIAMKTASDASVEVLRYATTVEHSLCKKLCANVNYSSLIRKNPFRLGWLVMEGCEEAYTLDELADYLDLSTPAHRSIDKHCGMRRNYHLLEMTCKWACRTVRQGWPEFSQGLDAVTQRVEMYNASLPVPLSPVECRAISGSTTKYIHRKFSPEEFSAVQIVRGCKGGIVKGETYEGRRFMASCMLENGYPQRAIAVTLSVHRNTIHNWAMHR